MSKIKGAIVVNENRCKGCGLCIEACPTNSISLTVSEVNSRGYVFCRQTNQEVCTGCTSCAVVCPDGCIEVYRKKEA